MDLISQLLSIIYRIYSEKVNRTCLLVLTSYDQQRPTNKLVCVFQTPNRYQKNKVTESFEKRKLVCEKENATIGGSGGIWCCLY